MKVSFSSYIRDAALIGIFVFLWNVNARLASIETTLDLMKSGKITIAAGHPFKP